jgi:hypothetical protein
MAVSTSSECRCPVDDATADRFIEEAVEIAGGFWQDRGPRE